MADTLREYLVSLGFRVDDASWRKYVGYVASAGRTTAELGSTAVEAATAIEVAVARVARQYESLYYVSQRTGQSANYIQAAGFAYRQMGLSAGAAVDAIEGVAAAMRTTPGLSAMFGGATKPEDIVERLRGLAQSSAAGYAVAARMAGMAGIPEQTFLHFMKFGPQEKAAADEYKTRLQEAGIDADKFADRVSKGEGSFTWALNKMESEFDILGTRIAIDWIDPTQHGIEVVQEVVHWFNEWDKATSGVIGKISSLVVTLGGLFGVEKILSKLLQRIGLGSGGTITGRVLGLVGGTTGLLTGGLLIGSTTTIGAEGETSLTRAGTAASLPPTAGTSGRGDPRGMLAAVRAAAVRNGINPDIMEAVARSEGLAESYAGGDHGTSFGAMQLHRGGPGSVGTEYERQTGHSLDDPANEAEEADFAARWARRHGWGAWMGAQKQGITGFAGIDAAVSGSNVAAQGSGDRLVTFHQKTDIHVSGATAAEVADRVFTKQARVNDNLVRNLVGAHR